MTESTKTTNTQNKTDSVGEDSHKFGGEGPPNSAQIPADQQALLTERLQSLRERVTTSNSEDTSETVGDLSHNVLNIFAVCGELMYVADPQKGNAAQQALENAPNDMKTGDLLNQIFNIYAP